MDLSLHIYGKLEELNALRPHWDELLTQYPAATTFCTWEWLTCWWQSFAGSRQLLVLALFDSASLVGLAPLSISKERVGWLSLRVLRLMGDGSGDSDNLDLPVRPGYETIFAETLLQYLNQLSPRWDIGLFDTFPVNSLLAGALSELLGSSPWTLFEYSSKSSAIFLPESWEVYNRTISAEERKNLIRYHRRLQARYSTRIYRCTRPLEVDVALEALFRLHQGRWRSEEQLGSFGSSERRDFYIRLSQCLLARRWLELWVLELNGEIAAVQFAFRYRERVFQLQEGYDHTRRSDRPGYVLRGEVLKQLISEQVRYYDFLGGEDSYKLRWGAREGHYRQLHFAPQFSVGALCLQWADRTGKSKEWLRHKLPHFAWEALHRANLAVHKKGQPFAEPDSKLINEAK
jgi:CelD/BcsL family acetyltransferase involved in cellulose biosynthesis